MNARFPRRFAGFLLVLSGIAGAAQAEDAAGDEDWLVSGGLSALMSVGGNASPLGYTLISAEVNALSPMFLEWDLHGGRLVVRNRIMAMGGAFTDGPESHLFALTGSPSLEFLPTGSPVLFFASVGGGVGLTDSRGYEIAGGQGQDFLLSWFAEAGFRAALTPSVDFFAALRYQHFSNGGMDDVNPGIDLLGPSLGIIWRF